MREYFTIYGLHPLGMSCVLIASAALIGCASRPATAPIAHVTPAAPAVERPVIVRLVGRDFSVVISSGSKGPVYTIRTLDGQLLAQNLTLDELQQSHADLYDKLAPAISPQSSAVLMPDK